MSLEKKPLKQRICDILEGIWAWLIVLYLPGTLVVGLYLDLSSECFGFTLGVGVCVLFMGIALLEWLAGRASWYDKEGGGVLFMVLYMLGFIAFLCLSAYNSGLFGVEPQWWPTILFYVGLFCIGYFFAEPSEQ